MAAVVMVAVEMEEARAAATEGAIWEQNARGTPGVKNNGWVTRDRMGVLAGFEPC